MFKRITYEPWHGAAPIIAFVLTFGVFIFFVVRAICLKRDEAQRLASLPLDLKPPTAEEPKNA